MANIQHCGYHSGDSILHAVEARTKVLLALAFIFASGIGSELLLLTIAFLCHLGILVSGLSISGAWKRLGELKILLLVLGGTPLFFTPGTPVWLFDGFYLPITKEGFECGIFAVSRLSLMIWVSMILVWTTPPESLMKIVSGVGSKFFPECKVLQEFVLVGGLAFQNLPYILAEAEEKMGEGWRRRGKLRRQGNILETSKEMARSLIMWTVKMLAEPERVIKRHKYHD